MARPSSAPPAAARRDASSSNLLLEPTVTWPDVMTVGKRHLVEVDLELVTESGAPLGPDDWPLDAEEYAYTCLLNGGGFDHWALRDNKVLMHRFGGCYQPAQFVVKPEKAGVRSLWLTVLNAGGVPVGSYELDVTVLDPPLPGVAPAKEDEPVKELVEVGLSPVDPPEPPMPVLVPESEYEPESVLAPETEPEPEPPVPLGEALVPVFEPAPGYDPDGRAQIPPGRDLDSDEDSASLRMNEQATIEIPYHDLPADVPDDVPEESPGDPAPFATVPDIPYPDSSPLGLNGPDGLPGVTRHDESLSADDEATRLLPSGERAPARRDRARLAVPRLTEWYSILGLRRSRNGSLHSQMLPLFSPGAVRGEQVTFTARCAPSDEHGTVFSVMAESEDAQRPVLASTQSAKVPPGIYRVTAELVDPGGGGQVRFNGLPAELGEERRPWREILGKLPSRLPDSGPAHLIAAIEVSGPDSLVGERIEAVRQLFTHVADQAADFVCYSVITYGPHSVNYNNRDFPEVPVAVPAWAETADDALHILSQAARRGAAPVGYEDAAQLECVLVDLNRSITGAEGRPVIVTAGGRPPHPRRVDPRTEIIPCRYRNDWAVPLRRLRRLSGISFGAIRDSGVDDQLWSLLGETSTAGPAEIVADSGQRFARDLGLTGQVPRLIPLPMFSDHPALRQVSPMP
jgi:hypothetical protein